MQIRLINTNTNKKFSVSETLVKSLLKSKPHFKILEPVKEIIIEKTEKEEVEKPKRKYTKRKKKDTSNKE